MKDNRRVSNLFIKSDTAMKFVKLVVGTWLFALVLNIAGNYFVYSSISKSIETQLGAEALQAGLSGELNGYLAQLITINVLTFTSLIWVVLAFLTIMNHRIFGPVESLKDFIGHLRNGNYDPPKRQLREKDELVPIMDELNILADTLRDKENQ